MNTGIHTFSLRRLRSWRCIHWVQLAAMLFWSLTPQFSRAVYVPDASDNPGAWVPLSPGDTAPPSGPDTSLDGNEVEVWRAQFIAARDSGAIVFWSGGSWMVSGVMQTFNGIWHVAGAGDADEDGIPEDLDPFPGDQTNNSFYWVGGAFTKYNPGIGNIYHIFRSGWFAGVATDANTDGLPDVLDDWFTNPSGHGTLQQFPGGTFLIQGAYSTFEAFSYYAASWADADGEGLPDEIDPFPSDAWNSTHYDWPGGDFYIDGVLTHFAAARYNGLFVDTDTGGGDGIPDVADPYPLDPANNSAYWQGGQFMINLVTQNLPARWHRADAADADMDSIPDDFDPYLNDAGNPTLQAGQFYWAGGSFRIDGQMNTFAGGVFTGTDGDQDADGLPDHFDVWVQDANNNSAWWPGGTFTISGQSEVLSGQWHHANSGDQDSDTIPDDLDPFPADPNNGTIVPAYWAGGSFYIDGQSVPFAGQYYTGDFIDPDGDGLPNFADIYPTDGTNNSFNWSGGEFTINDIFVRFGPGWYAGGSTDSNNNSVPDCLDDWFADPSTHGQFQQWAGGTFTCDGQPRTWPALKYYAAGLNDADLDTIPDEIDPYLADANNNSGFTWPAVQMTILYGNVQTLFSPTQYGGVFSDSDGDTIPDQAETNDYLNDQWNGNDSDGDLIPDHVEVQYPSVLDRTNLADATNARPADGITYLRLYQYNVEAAMQPEPLAAVALDQPFPAARDSDIDSMPDAYELRYTLDPFDRLDAVESPAGDLVFNFEKAAHADDPATFITPENYTAYTGQTHADALSHHNSAQSNAENDWDGDKVSNIDELFVFGTNARNGSLRPSDEQIIWAITGTQLLSISTGINFLYLVTSCICSNTYCPHSITCNSTDHGASCACTYAPPPCACSGANCTSRSSCACVGVSSSDGACYTSCSCGGANCSSPGTCSCGGGSGNCSTPPSCSCSYSTCPGATCSTPGSGCTCGTVANCTCNNSSTTNPCPGSGCSCGGTGSCGGTTTVCPGCNKTGETPPCPGLDCSCGGDGTCVSTTPQCDCGKDRCPGTTPANDGPCAQFTIGSPCAGCCYCGVGSCFGSGCSAAGKGTTLCSCAPLEPCGGFSGPACTKLDCPGSGCTCGGTGNCVCADSNGTACTEPNCPGAGCSCAGSGNCGATAVVGVIPPASQGGNPPQIIGDFVPSVNPPTGDPSIDVTHFVTPKKSTELNEPYVELKATVTSITNATFDDEFRWDNSVGVTTTADKCQVSRNTPGKFEIKVIRKSTNDIVSQIYVWVVWADGSVTQQGVSTFNRQADTTIDGTATTSAVWAMPTTKWKFKFTIQPATIITEQERPELSGAKQSPPPGGNSEFTGKPLAGGADKKWDVSRRVKYRIVNPGLKPKGKFSSGFGSLYDGQPQADSIAVQFPTDTVIGNDDSGFGDEENHPYSAATGSIPHGVGEISSFDGPSIWIPEAGSSNGHTLEEHDLFGEFARLNIGSNWYRISSFVDWKTVAKLSMQNGQWSDGGCSTSTGN